VHRRAESVVSRCKALTCFLSSSLFLRRIISLLIHVPQAYNFIHCRIFFAYTVTKLIILPHAINTNVMSLYQPCMRDQLRAQLNDHVKFYVYCQSLSHLWVGANVNLSKSATQGYRTSIRVYIHQFTAPVLGRLLSEYTISSFHPSLTVTCKVWVSRR